MSKASSKTLVIQSHRQPLPYSWLNPCLESVRRWCKPNRLHYHYLDDELFTAIPEELQAGTQNQAVIAADLARLHVLQKSSDKGYRTVIWLDADFLIFNPGNFVLPDTSYAVGREVWVQRNQQGKLKVYKKVHNAFLMFRQPNSFLPFYIETAERLLRQNPNGKPPQFIGPKLLTALHNICQLPVMESAGMLSPVVIEDILQGGGKALQLFIERSPTPIAGANLCISSRQREELTCAHMELIISTLLQNKGIFQHTSQTR